MGAAWGAAFNFSKALNKRGDLFSLKKLNGYLLGLFLFSWAGAKLFYLWTADFGGKDLAASSSSFWLGGGFVFYGGLVFGLVFTLFFSLITSQSLKKFNIFLAPLALGHGIGRFGCLMAGCCYGHATEFPLAVHLWGERRHPTQIYEGVFLFVLAYIFSRKKMLQNGHAVWFYLLWYGVFRFLIEFLRGDALRGVYALGLSTSQYTGLGMVALSLFVLRGVVFRPIKKITSGA